MTRSFVDNIKEMTEQANVEPTGLVYWLRQTAQPTLAKAWRSCPHGGWLLWLASHSVVDDSPEHRALVAATVACVRAGMPDPAPDVALAVLDAADAWATGTGTSDAVWQSILNAENALYPLYFQGRYEEVAFTQHAANAAWVAEYSIDAGAFAHMFDDERYAAIIRRHIRRAPRLPRAAEISAMCDSLDRCDIRRERIRARVRAQFYGLIEAVLEKM